MTLVRTVAGAATDSVSHPIAVQDDSQLNVASATAQAANLFLLEDLEDNNRTRELAESDLVDLLTAADWISTFVGRPHKDLGRDGAVCPYVPPARERRILWLAPERIAARSVLEVVDLIASYKKLLLDAQPVAGDDANYKSIAVVFSDLPAERAKDVFDGVLQQLGVRSYAEDGLVLGAFYERNEGRAIYNPNFRPFAAPVPFLLMRPAIISDWKFFLDNEEWLNSWARRFREAAVHALADELRLMPWRERRD